MKPIYKVKLQTPYGYRWLFYQGFLEENNLISSFSTQPESVLREEYNKVKAHITEIDKFIYESGREGAKKANNEEISELSEERCLLTQYKCDLYNEIIKRKRNSVSNCNQKLLDNWYLTGSLFSTSGKTGKFLTIKGRYV